jgi:ubiquitin-conjugating enzyme E2 variant
MDPESPRRVIRPEPPHTHPQPRCGAPGLDTKALLDRLSVTLFFGTWVLFLMHSAGRFAPIDTWGKALAAGLGIVVGYLLADLLAGLVHWIADRYFDPATPVLGPMLIEPFRDHHRDSLGITRHDFFEVSGNNALVTLPLLGLLWLGPEPSDFGSRLLVASGASLALALVATNQFHRWAHDPAPPRFVRRLHALGLILTPRRHAVHHRGRHDRAYCVTSGWLNPLLDRIRIFEGIEQVVGMLAGRRRRTNG